MRYLRPGVLSFVCLLVLLSAADASGKVRLRLDSIPSGDSPHPRDLANREIFTAFRDAHPEIEMAARRESLGAGMKLNEQAFLMAQAANLAPDVMDVNCRQARSFVRQKFLLPLNKVMSDDEARGWRERIPAKIRDLVVDEDGTIWAWGNNEFGELGLGHTVVRATPTEIQRAP